MTDSILENFLNEFPLKSKWLDDIIHVLLRRPSGTAHVKDIAKDLNALNRDRYIASIEETVTRRINDFCSDAADFKKDDSLDFFQRVEPATYRLRSYPNAPNILEVINIEFDDSTMNDVWKLFNEIAEKKNRDKWTTLGNGRKLAHFVNNFQSNTHWKTEFDERKAFLSKQQR